MKEHVYSQNIESILKFSDAKIPFIPHSFSKLKYLEVFTFVSSRSLVNDNYLFISCALKALLLKK